MEAIGLLNVVMNMEQDLMIKLILVLMLTSISAFAEKSVVSGSTKGTYLFIMESDLSDAVRIPYEDMNSCHFALAKAKVATETIAVCGTTLEYDSSNSWVRIE